MSEISKADALVRGSLAEADWCPFLKPIWILTMKAIRLGTIMRLLALGTIPAAASSHAALINLDQPAGAPDIFVGGFNVSYSAATGVFSASTPDGWASVTCWYHDADQFDTIGTFNLTANFNSDHSLSGGLLEIRGDIGNGDELLLCGSLRPGNAGSAFGFQDPGPGGAGTHDLFQFTFNVTGGNQAVLSDFLAWGNVGGICLDANFAYNGSDTPFMGFWNSDFFSSNHNGVCDVVVPEPRSYAWSVCGAAAMCAAFWRPRRRGLCAKRESDARKELQAAG